MIRRMSGVLVAAVLITVLGGVGAGARDRDMVGIEKLHEQDIAATVPGDPKALAALWTDDAVLLEPGRDADIGKAQITAKDLKTRAEQPGFRMLTYVPEIKDVKIVDGWAFEWGSFTASYQDSAGGETKSFQAKLLRVLRKQADGSWKFARVMWN